jgi:hypothetical protein
VGLVKMGGGCASLFCRNSCWSHRIGLSSLVNVGAGDYLEFLVAVVGLSRLVVAVQARFT